MGPDPSVVCKSHSQDADSTSKRPPSWRYQAAIHDYLEGEDPLSTAGDVLPPKTEQKRFWRQCQHGSWFFLPWHRMYLFYFEQTVKAAIAELKGDSASWSLPYWNYSDSKNPKARCLPPAFIADKLPDGSPNPLRVADRQEGNDGKAVGDENNVDIGPCLADLAFAAAPAGGNPGFGGPQTKFEHSGQRTGKLELTPHGNMHVAVGGWMGSFNTAALDPIFCLHHANIDRLWNVWLGREPQRANPTIPAWLTAVKFEFHDASGKIVSLTPDKVDDSTAAPLSYEYDDESDPFAGIAPPLSKAMVAEEPSIPEMVGATSAPVILRGKPAHAQFAVRQPTGPARRH
jgi:tyrosinase